MRLFKNCARGAGLCAALWLWLVLPVFAQEINLDRMETCGDLICYPSLEDPNRFHYLPDQPRLAVKEGRPQFSFLKYARTQSTGKAGTGQAEGGGIVHFLVTYGVSEDQVREAEQDLQERHPGAKIVSPIVYRKGSFALITSFKEGEATTTRTVAVGKAPLMEGQKAAVSMNLTREGAELLWESFKTDTPDISLVFDMEFAGVREPYEATLEADWSRVSKHDRLQAGVKYAWFGADVDMLFQELRQSGAVKITTKGEHAAFDKIIQSANDKLLRVMFDPAPSDELTRAEAQKNGYSNLNQAVRLLKDASSSRRSGRTAPSPQRKRTSALDPKLDAPLYDPVWMAHFNLFSAEAHAGTSDASKPSASDAYNHARRLHRLAQSKGYPADATRRALEAYLAYQRDHKPTGDRAKEVAGLIRSLQARLKRAGAASQPSRKNQNTPSNVGPGASTGSNSKGGPGSSAQQSRVDGSPGFSLVASYQMKRIKRSGKLVYQMNHYRTESQAFAMAENIGSIYSRYGDDPRVFRAVTIDDPVFKQREILVTLDGQDASTFTRHLNFVTVKMKKRHQAGEVTTGEVVITPESFNASGNRFTMNYGWKDDHDRTAWLTYDYQAIWSFHGGIEVRTPWTETESAMLALNPPHRYRTVALEGDGLTLSSHDVRHAVVTMTCRIGDRHITSQATIRNIGPAPALLLDVPEDPGNPETRVAITWFLHGGRQIEAEPRKLEGDIVYWDELPKGGI